MATEVRREKEIIENTNNHPPTRACRGKIAMVKQIEKYLLNIADRYVYTINSTEEFITVTLMERGGGASASCAIYTQFPNIIYLNNLYVKDGYKRQGIGRELQEIRERVGMVLGCKIAQLSAKKGSWQMEWYKRREYFPIDSDGDKNVYMTKIL